MQVASSLVGGFFLFHLYRMRSRVSVVASSGHLLGDLQAWLAARDLKAAGVNLLCNVDGRVAANAGELISEIAVERLEPRGQIDPGVACRTDGDIAAVQIGHLVAFD